MTKEETKVVPQALVVVVAKDLQEHMDHMVRPRKGHPKQSSPKEAKDPKGIKEENE